MPRTGSGMSARTRLLGVRTCRPAGCSACIIQHASTFYIPTDHAHSTISFLPHSHCLLQLHTGTWRASRAPTRWTSGFSWNSACLRTSWTFAMPTWLPRVVWERRWRGLWSVQRCVWLGTTGRGGFCIWRGILQAACMHQRCGRAQIPAPRCVCCHCSPAQRFMR